MGERRGTRGKYVMEEESRKDVRMGGKKKEKIMVIFGEKNRGGMD